MRLVRAGASAATFRLALVSATAAVLATSCHVPGTGGSGPSTIGSGTITVGVVPGLDNAPLQVGVTDGLFRQHGLTVNVQSYTSVAQVMTALTTGKINIAEGDYTDFFYQQAQGNAKLSLIADGYDAVANSMAILTLPQYNITSPQDLEGKTVASPPAPAGVSTAPGLPFNMPTLAAEQVLQSDALSPTSVFWRQMSPASMLGALSSGRVHAILATEPYIFEAEEKLGAAEVIDSSNGVTGNLPLAGYFSLASYASQQPTNVEAFQAALSQAQTNAAMGEQVQSLLPGYVAGMTKQDAAMVTLGTYPTALSVGQVSRVVNLMVDSGMISTLISLGHCSGNGSACMAVAP